MDALLFLALPEEQDDEEEEEDGSVVSAPSGWAAPSGRTPSPAWLPRGVPACLGWCVGGALLLYLC